MIHNMLHYLAERYKTFVKRNYFKKAEGNSKQYAFVGTGTHARAQLYPVLQHLSVELTYIYSRNLQNSKRMAAIYKNCIGTNDLNIICQDANVAGVFVCLSEEKHFEIAQQLLSAGKHVFIEKPPCQTLTELDKLLITNNSKQFHVNLQQRFSPCAKILKANTSGAKFYNLEYKTGYAEGNLLTNLFIHAMDMAVYLFGEVQHVRVQKIESGKNKTYLLLATHTNQVAGQLKLSTAYNWQNSKEIIEMHCGDEVYNCDFPFAVTKTSMPKTPMGLPLEKLLKTPVTQAELYSSKNISTSAANHFSNTYGFYNSINAFLLKVEKNEGMQKKEEEQLRLLFRFIEMVKNSVND